MKTFNIISSERKPAEFLKQAEALANTINREEPTQINLEHPGDEVHLRERLKINYWPVHLKANGELQYQPPPWCFSPQQS